MRVSNNMNYDQVKGNISKNRSDMADLQNQAATQKRITKPSDDPIGTARSLTLRTEKTGIDQYMKNADLAKGFMNITESSLADLTDLLSRAKELAISQASDPSTNAEGRIATASEVDQIFKDMVAIANRRMGERYIFGGYKTTKSPFDHNGNYKGDSGAIQVEVNKGVYSTINLPGDKLFLGRDSALAQVPDNRRGSTTPNYPGVDAPKEESVSVRGPASVGLDQDDSKVEKKEDQHEPPVGENLFNVVKSLSNGLRANDTVAIQDTLERLDSGLEQVVLLRGQIGSRTASLESTQASLMHTKVDDSALLSSIEDADAFEVFTDITKNENTLKATLQTSGKLIQPSLLDFLR
jgi:flagellar hook-associated protein 3 FlgL